MLSEPPSAAPAARQLDAVVIGAGLSGLTAAAYLAQGGARVLVCEQAAQPGGLFNSFRRQGYTFDGGIKAVENSAVVMPALAKLGLLDQLRFQPSPVGLVTGGHLRPMRGFADIAAYFDALAALFPADAGGLQRVLADARLVFDLLDGLLCFPIPFFDRPGQGDAERSAWINQYGRRLLRFPRAVGLLRGEFRPYLHRRLSSPALVNLLAGLFPDGTSPFFGLGYFRMFLDYYYPQGGIQSIPNALVDLICAQGGQVRLNARVDSILLEQGRAVGIILAGGEEIRAGYVIAAGDLRSALTRLLPPGAVPLPYTEKLQGAEVSHSVFNLFLGLDLPPERLPLQGCRHFFYMPDLVGINEKDREEAEDYFSRVPQEISVPCLDQPELAPPGKTGLVVSAMTSWDYLGGWEHTPAAYARLKDRCARQLISSLEKCIPGLNEHIELSFAATPRTIHTLTGNTQGAIMGWSYHSGRGLKRGSILKMRQTVLMPIPHLLSAGHWSFSPGGSPVAMLTGLVAAEHVLTHS